MPQVSVIVPIYNAEPYLAQCLESIQAQTLQDIEVICINDGSTDSSLETINEFAYKDDRFIVIDKKNGGYGCAVNTGIAQAKGEYLAIVEPDDFIDPHMYEELLAFKNFDTETPADIIKGSYWEYYDANGEVEEIFVEPYLSQVMHHSPFAFTAAENAAMLLCHPSIWAALYRKAFLAEQDITFVEVPGAGWADNPFFFETIPAAEKIVWVPKPYYYYRITNSSSSSYVKDYRFIFERLREIRKTMHERNTTPGVWAAFYETELRYIKTIMNEYGFAEKDPEFMSYIKEVISDMDPAIFFSHDCLVQEKHNYYRDICALIEAEDSGKQSVEEKQEQEAEKEQQNIASEARTHDAQNQGCLATIILPLFRNANYLTGALTELAALPPNIEILAVDCRTLDRAPLLFKQFANAHSSFRILPDEATSIPEGINAAIQTAQGEYLFIYNIKEKLRYTVLQSALEAAYKEKADVVLFDTNGYFTVEAMKATGTFKPMQLPEEDDSFLSPTFKPEQGAGFLFNCVEPGRYAALYRKQHLMESGLALKSGDVGGCAGFTGRASLAAQRILYCHVKLFAPTWDDQINLVRPPTDLRTSILVEPEISIPGVLEFVSTIDLQGPFGQSARDLTVASFTYDLGSRRNYANLKTYFDCYFEQVSRILETQTDTVPQAHACYSESAWLEFQFLKSYGLEGYLSKMYFKQYQKTQLVERELDELQNSTTMRVGMKMYTLSKKVLPDKLVTKIKGTLSKRKTEEKGTN